MTKRHNRLQFEKSPYLLQHAGNPVDWYPWGEEAFAKARREDKPIFLSIGYSTCHWCHVMEEESFADQEVARLMNETFVSIKVDREERPDIDQVYMSVCQMLTGGGGWPLNIVMTADKQPFFAATYIPRESKDGRMGMLELIPRIREVWSKQRAEALKSAGQIIETLRAASTVEYSQKIKLEASLLESAYKQLAESFDGQYGGFSPAPKFPSAHKLYFLLRYWRRTKDAFALEMVEQTLQAMRRGGIFDHLGGGFHRYSTDARWLLPHFEKMLYDQALSVIAYTETYQATGKAEYARTAKEILGYVLREMTAPEGGFYSAEDADSEGVEGKYYLWTAEDIRLALGDKDTDFAFKVFNIEEGGNFTEQLSAKKTGNNILYRKKSLSQLSQEFSVSKEQLQNKLASVRKKLFNYRKARVRPLKDDKLLTDWNGLMIAALAKAARAFEQPEYAASARRSADFILDEMRLPNGRLLHRYRQGQATVLAYIDDYAFLSWGLLELYEATFEVRYLEAAIQLNEHLLQHFWDEANGGFYFTADDSEQLLVRQKGIYDGAVPSGNAVALLNLLRLGQIGANSDYVRRSERIESIFARTLKQQPSAHTQFLAALDFKLGPTYEVIIAGNRTAPDTQTMLRALRRRFLPNKIVLLRPTDEETPAITRVAPYTKNYTSIEGKATAYVCYNYNCKLPTTDVNKMLELLR